ncbi:unnamed protein product [Paramecium sonneborni]|uniref:Transmembrane protein n=1 Tax=Paramecium sonneborni TaxID=65129 RepID=A0A8S1N057_9CILI|nr:unnamed protein product [Paramecium sonneborni]
MNIIQQLEIDQEDGFETKFMSFEDSDLAYNYLKIPPDLEKAQLHRQAYTVHKTPLSNSQQCFCCHFYKDHIKYTFFEGRKYYHHHSSIGEYFELIKYCIYQLLIIGILLVPYCLITYSNGNQCEKIQDCDTNTNKIYSVWNLIPDYYSLDDQKYSYFVHITFLILQIVHFIFFNNKKAAKRIQTAAMFEYLKQVCLYFPKTIHQNIIKYMKNRQPNLFEYIVFDQKKYEKSLFEELKVQYSRIYDKDNKWKKKILMQLLQNDTLLEECIIGRIVLMDKLVQIKGEVYTICNRYNQEVQNYEYQDTQKKQIQAIWFIIFNLIFSYYLPRVLITLTMFFRLKLITIYFDREDLKITQGIIKGLFGITQILILKLSDYICKNGSLMVHQNIQLYPDILQNGLIA